MGISGSWAAPNTCPGPLARCKQAAHGQQRDKSPWLCLWRGLSSTVHISWDGIMHRWQQITGGTSGGAVSSSLGTTLQLESPPKLSCCFTPSPGLWEVEEKSC